MAVKNMGVKGKFFLSKRRKMGATVTIKNMMTSEEFIFINISPPMPKCMGVGSNG